MARREKQQARRDSSGIPPSRLTLTLILTPTLILILNLTPTLTLILTLTSTLTLPRAGCLTAKCKPSHTPSASTAHPPAASRSCLCPALQHDLCPALQHDLCPAVQHNLCSALQYDLCPAPHYDGPPGGSTVEALRAHAGLQHVAEGAKGAARGGVTGAQGGDVVPIVGMAGQAQAVLPPPGLTLAASLT